MAKSTRALIDWISATQPRPSVQSIPSSQLVSTILRAWERLAKNRIAGHIWSDPWEEMPGRAPYESRLSLGREGLTVFWSAALDTMLIEISGHGCQRLRERGELDAVVQWLAPRVTRLDVAVDIETETEPAAFVRESGPNRFQTFSTFDSSTGSTRYVGSYSSERYARVYRYRPPLPRSHLLRVEHVFRRSWARTIAELIAREGILSAAKYSAGVWGWHHEDWDLEHYDHANRVTREVSTRAPNTVQWVLSTVFPCLRSLEKKGVIPDLRAFVEVGLFLSDDADDVGRWAIVDTETGERWASSDLHGVRVSHSVLEG